MQPLPGTDGLRETKSTGGSPTQTRGVARDRKRAVANRERQELEAQLTLDPDAIDRMIVLLEETIKWLQISVYLVSDSHLPMMDYLASIRKQMKDDEK